MNPDAFKHFAMTPPAYTLRRLTLADIDTPLLQRPVVCRGDGSLIRRYAYENGYRFKAKPNMLFGGYFVNTAGDCLLPT